MLLVYLFDQASNHFYLSQNISSNTLHDVQLYEHAIALIHNELERIQCREYTNKKLWDGERKNKINGSNNNLYIDAV